MTPVFLLMGLLAMSLVVAANAQVEVKQSVTTNCQSETQGLTVSNEHGHITIHYCILAKCHTIKLDANGTVTKVK